MIHTLQQSELLYGPLYTILGLPHDPQHTAL